MKSILTAVFGLSLMIGSAAVSFGAQGTATPAASDSKMATGNAPKGTVKVKKHGKKAKTTTTPAAAPAPAPSK